MLGVFFVGEREINDGGSSLVEREIVGQIQDRILVVLLFSNFEIFRYSHN